jgi:serine/threonine protein kinase
VLTYNVGTPLLICPPGGKRELLELGERLGSGGEGGVYRAKGKTTAIKLLKNPTALARRKILAMLERAPERVRHKSRRGEEVVQFSWPEALVENSAGRFVGFAMPFLDPARVATFATWTNRNLRKKHGLEDDLQRLYVAMNLAALVEYVNAAGHHVVDLRDDNIRIYREGGFVCLIDCDGFNIRGTRESFPTDVAAQTVLAPELHGGANPSHYDSRQDRFALAVTLFQLLDNGFHPAAGVPGQGVAISEELTERIRRRQFFVDHFSGLAPPPTSDWPYFADETQALFRRAFVGPPGRRPTATEWVKHCRLLISIARRIDADRNRLDYGKGSRFGPPPRRARVATTPPATTPIPIAAFPKAAISYPPLKATVHFPQSGSPTQPAIQPLAPSRTAAPKWVPPVGVPPAPPYRLFDAPSVALASWFGSPLLGGILIARNYRLAGWSLRRRRVLAVITGFMLLVLQGLLINYFPSDAASLAIPLAGAAVTGIFAHALQRELLRTHARARGRLIPKWQAFGLGFTIPAACLLLIWLSTKLLH